MPAKDRSERYKLSGRKVCPYYKHSTPAVSFAPDCSLTRLSVSPSATVGTRRFISPATAAGIGQGVAVRLSLQRCQRLMRCSETAAYPVIARFLCRFCTGFVPIRFLFRFASVRILVLRQRRFIPREKATAAVMCALCAFVRASARACTLIEEIYITHRKIAYSAILGKTEAIRI